MLKLVESISSDNFINFIIDLSENSFEELQDIGKVFAVWMAACGAFDDAFEQHFISGYPESRLAQLIMSYFAGSLCVFSAYFSYLFVSFCQILKFLLSGSGIEDIICV